MTVEELLGRMSSHEIGEWRAYFNIINQIDEERAMVNRVTQKADEVMHG